MSPIGSYVGGLTSKGQVGVLLGEHRGWILRMATLIKGRLSDNRPEACGLPFRLKNSEHLHAFPYPNIQNSTFPQPQAGPLTADRPTMHRKFLRISDVRELWAMKRILSLHSREGNVQHAFHLPNYCILNV